MGVDRKVYEMMIKTKQHSLCLGEILMVVLSYQQYIAIVC